MRQIVLLPQRSPFLGGHQHHIQEDQAVTYMVRCGYHLLQNICYSLALNPILELTFL